MKPKTMILLGLAITCGLGASYMTSRLLAERNVSDVQETVDILVAKQNLSVHTHITKPEDLFEVKRVNKDQEPPDAIRDFDSLRGKKLKQGRVRGDHITPASIYEKGGGVEIPEGYQAIGVPVNLQTTAHGLATLPGSRVDLQLTIKGQNVLDTTSILVLQNVLVLAADVRVTPEGEIAAPAQVVTFALKQKDILKINACMDMGTIRLIMRKHDDNSVATETTFVGRDIHKKDQVAKADTSKPVQPTIEPKEVKPQPPQVEDNRPKLTYHRYPDRKSVV